MNGSGLAGTLPVVAERSQFQVMIAIKRELPAALACSLLLLGWSDRFFGDIGAMHECEECGDGARLMAQKLLPIALAKPDLGSSFRRWEAVDLKKSLTGELGNQGNVVVGGKILAAESDETIRNQAGESLS